MGSKSDYAENKVLDLIFGGTAFGAPATLYFGLLTTLCNDASTSGSLSPGVEVSGGNYARAVVTNNGTNFGAASGGSKTNATDIVFNAPNANWGTIVGFFVSDVASGAGNILYWGAISPSKTVNNGDPAPKIAASGLTITED